MPLQNHDTTEGMDYHKIVSLLSDLRSSDANFITLWLPPGDKFSRVEDMLADQVQKTSSMLQSGSLDDALSAISAEEGQVQGDGVMFFVGYTDRQEQIVISFKGPYPGGALQSSLYLMDHKFHFLETQNTL